MITAKQLERAVGVTRRTLSNWQAAGLIPNPVRGQSASGRGSVGLYPDDTLETAKAIKQHQARGATVNEISHVLAAEQTVAIGTASQKALDLLRKFDSHAEHGTHAPSSQKEGVRCSVRTALTRELTAALQPILSPHRAAEVAQLATTDAHLGAAVHLAWLGYGPVLMVVGESEPYITTDFLVAQDLSLRGEFHTRNDADGRLLAFDEHYRNVVARMSARVVLPLRDHINIACELVGERLSLRRAIPATVLELIAPKRDDPDQVDATVHVNYNIQRAAGGVYGRLIFALQPTTKRIATVGNAFV